jgi:cellulose synthase/poly-beta-1,6-N-acetylglucosamine synthase-like glycosyltransferase
MTIEIVFWLVALVVGYAYLGYPVVLAFAARWGTLPRRALRPRPRLSVIVAAYNEANVIEAKIRSALEQSYPADRLEVIVVSDGSTDGTDERVRGFGDRRVKLVRQEPRAGKSLALNRGVSVATGDLLIFTDANALFGPDSLVRLAAGFHDPRVGLVSGQGLYAAGDAEAPRAVGNGYVRYEAFIKSRESLLGFVASADGAIYALRRQIYRDLDPAEVNDLLHPIQASLEGFESRFDPHAFTMEPPSPGSGSEFRRHVRIIAQGFTLLSRWLPRLVANHRWRATWMLLSHRLLRWMSAPCLATALIANAWLAIGEPFYRLTLAGQAAFYGLALLGLLAERAALPLGKLAVPYYFCVVSAAGVGGFARYLRGGGDAVWTPRGQASMKDRAA